MRKTLHVITSSKPSDIIQRMLDAVASNFDRKTINIDDDTNDVSNKNVVVAADLDDLGYNLELINFISRIYKNDKYAFNGSRAILIVNSPSEFYTKSFAQEIIFRLNLMGCAFPGHPLIENIIESKNFSTWQIHLDMSLFDISLEMCRRLGKRFDKYIETCKMSISSEKKLKLLALHASSNSASNTLALWHMVKQHIDFTRIDVHEFNVENGTIVDCKGCEFTTCMHYSKRNSCFYGGVITKELLPAIEESDIIVWVCPNYNDAISAKLMAVINRLTVLYRRQIPYNKRIYGVIVSGNSGSDTLAKQLIGALNINKGFRLPPYFMISAIANNPGDINTVKDIEKVSGSFAEKINQK